MSKNWLQFCIFKMAVIWKGVRVCQNRCSFVVSEMVKQQTKKIWCMSSKNWLQFCSFKMAVIRMEGTVCQNVCSFVVSETVKQQDQKKLVYVFEKVVVVLQFQNGSDLEGCQSLPKPLQFCSFRNGQTVGPKKFGVCLRKTGCSFVVSKWQ